jgi:hypothetical protein
MRYAGLRPMVSPHVPETLKPCAYVGEGMIDASVGLYRMLEKSGQLLPICCVSLDEAQLVVLDWRLVEVA